MTGHRRFRLSCLALGVAAMLGACGGGGDEPTAAAPLASETRRTALDALRERADAEHIGKTVHVLGGANLGAYGRVLAASGYQFRHVSDLSEVPATPTTMLYLRHDGGAPDAALDLAGLNRFKGVLILDSDQLRQVSSGEIAVDEGTGLAATAGAEDEAAAASSHVGELFRLIAAGSAVAAPDATAVVTSQATGTFMPLYVDGTGRVNGYDAGEFDAVGPQLFALSALDTARGTLKRPARLMDNNDPSARKGRLAATGVPWDRVVDINISSSGYYLRGRYYVLAWRELGPSFLSARKFVDVLVDTGSNDAGCMVSGQLCGIYPKDKYEVVKSLSSSGTGDVMVAVAPHYYYAQVGVKPWTQTMTWMPRASHWTSSSTKETDSWEVTWSTGFSVGGSLGAGLSHGTTWSQSMSLGISGAYSRSVVHRKRSYAWVGYESNYTSSGYGYVRSGLQAVNTKVRGAMESSWLWKSGDKGSAWNRMSDTMMGGYWGFCQHVGYGYWDCNTGKQKVNGDGTPRSRIAWEGWNPSVSSSMEIPKNYFESTSSSKTVSVSGRLAMERKRFTYTRLNSGVGCVTEGYLTTTPAGYRLKGVSYTHDQCNKGKTHSPTGTNSSGVIIHGTVNVTIGVNTFNN